MRDSLNVKKGTILNDEELEPRKKKQKKETSVKKRPDCKVLHISRMRPDAANASDTTLTSDQPASENATPMVSASTTTQGRATPDTEPLISLAATHVNETGIDNQVSALSEVPTASTPGSASKDLELSVSAFARQFERAFDALNKKMDDHTNFISRRLEAIHKRVVCIEMDQKENRTIMDKMLGCSSEQDASIHVDVVEATIQPENENSEHQSTTGDSINDGIPVHFQIPLDMMHELHCNSKGKKKLCKKIVEKLYPELFGHEMVCKGYSYNGGGLKGKQELEPFRKLILRRYVFYFYPKLSRPMTWQSVVVNLINEGLRRPVCKQQSMPAEMVVTTSENMCPRVMVTLHVTSSITTYRRFRYIFNGRNHVYHVTFSYYGTDIAKK